MTKTKTVDQTTDPINQPLGSVFIDIAGATLTADDTRRLQHPATGGLVLFSRNYQTPEQITELIAEIRALRSPSLLIAVDQEGGRVQRFQTGFTRLPAAAALLEHTAGEITQACEMAKTFGWLMAAELRSVGVDFSFAPVLDLDYGLSSIIGDRAFAAQATDVSRLGQAWMQGARTAGMISVGKHFPGHGGVQLDSHLDLPIDTRDIQQIEQQDLQPFQHLITEGLEAIMPAHLVYTAYDSHPAGFSSRWLQHILREKLGFDGAILSDDLNMQAAITCYPTAAERATAALQAGCDALLICNNPTAADEILETVPQISTPTAANRLARLYGQPTSFDLSTLQQQHRWRAANQLAKTLEKTLT